MISLLTFKAILKNHAKELSVKGTLKSSEEQNLIYIHRKGAPELRVSRRTSSE